MTAPLHRPRTALDLLRIPFIGRALRWRWGRLIFQIPLFVFAVLLIIDGFTGPPEASRNLATVAPWVHYRGLVVLVLLLVGNLFCMGCPFTIPRTLAKRLSISGRRWPSALRNKWLAISGLFLLFFLYEYLDMWASPALTAWLIVAYFVASFVLEAVFSESAFCKYVCPLGTFNFVYATAAPTQIGVSNPDVCATCIGKECINGSYAPVTTIRVDQIPVAGGETTEKSVTHSPAGTLGCGTQLFPPQITGNMDCVLCLDCVRACPHDNVGLFLRKSGAELDQPDAWRKSWDVSFLAIVLAFMGLTNAFGMVPPVYELQAWLVETLNINSELIVLGGLFVVGNLLLPAIITLTAATITRAVTRNRISLRHTVATFAPAFVPIGFGIWIAHYGFHFLIAPLSIIPVIQEFLGGTGDWARYGGALSGDWIGLIQVISLLGGFLWSLLIAQRAALRVYRKDGLIALLPWALIFMLMLYIAFQIFSLPMEMRGTDFIFS